MKYFSECKLKFIIESYIRNAIYDLNTAQLQGLFKSESYACGQLNVLEKLSKDLNLQIDVDKMKF